MPIQCPEDIPIFHEAWVNGWAAREVLGSLATAVVGRDFDYLIEVVYARFQMQAYNLNGNAVIGVELEVDPYYSEKKVRLYASGAAVWLNPIG